MKNEGIQPTTTMEKIVSLAKGGASSFPTVKSMAGLTAAGIMVPWEWS